MNMCFCILQARGKLSQIQDCQQEMSKGIEQYSSTLNGTNGGSMTNLADMSEGFNDKESGGFSAAGKGRQVRKCIHPIVDHMFLF